MNSFLYRDERRKWESPPPLKHEVIHNELKREALDRLRATVADNVSLTPMIQGCPDEIMDLPISSIYWKIGLIFFVERIGLGRIDIPEDIKFKKLIEWPIGGRRAWV